MERRLAAVLIADVVGYGRLSQLDEEGTRLRFQADLREIFQPRIADRHGRLVKTMGDGVLVEFNSIVDAVRCALEVQQLKAERKASEAALHRLDFRIGINLGDIIVEDEDIQGDGVNIAARLQAMAPPGGIVISGTAYDHVKTKLPVGYTSMGLRKVKSIAEPVRVYRVEPGPARTNGGRRMHVARPVVAAAILFLVSGVAAAWWLPWPSTSPGAEATARVATRPSVVVLPFDAMSDDKEQAYLANGFTEDLTTELARIPGLFVVSRNAAFAYKGKETVPKEIAAALQVEYLLEGSIRRIGNDIRFNAQLIDGSTAGHLWAERFDGDWSDVFRLQDEVVSRIAETLKLRLTVARTGADDAGGTADPAAYEMFLRAKELKVRDRPEDVVEVVALFRKAVSLDPKFGKAWADLAWTYWETDEERQRSLGLTWDQTRDQIYACLDAASKYPSATYFQLKAELLTRERRSDEAIGALLKAVTLDPSNSWTYEELAQTMTFNGKPREGRDYLDAALKVDPGWNDWRRYEAGLSAFGQGRFEDAAAELNQIDLSSPELWSMFYGLQVLLSSYGHLGRADQAAIVRDKLKAVVKASGQGEFTQLLTQQFFVYKSERDVMRLLDGLTKAGVPEFGPTDLSSLDRLSGRDITSLVLAHERRGHRTSGGVRDDYHAVPSSDGGLTRTLGSRTVTGRQWVQGDFFCAAYPRQLSSCGAMFRNRSGTPELQNEYVVLYRDGIRVEFSLVN